MKKSFRTAPKYVAFLGYKAGYFFPFSYIKLEAADAEGAMNECEYLFNNNVCKIILLKNTNETDENGLLYNGWLATRDGITWHKNDRAHGETECTVCYTLYGDYDIINIS